MILVVPGKGVELYIVGTTNLDSIAKLFLGRLESGTHPLNYITAQTIKISLLQGVETTRTYELWHIKLCLSELLSRNKKKIKTTWVHIR